MNQLSQILPCWTICHISCPVEPTVTDPALLNHLSHILPCWTNCHISYPVEPSVTYPALLNHLSHILPCWTICHISCPVESSVTYPTLLNHLSQILPSWTNCHRSCPIHLQWETWTIYISLYTIYHLYIFAIYHISCPVENHHITDPVLLNCLSGPIKVTAKSQVTSPLLQNCLRCLTRPKIHYSTSTFASWNTC